MNRTILGVLLLLVLLLGGICAAAGLSRESLSLATQMDAAVQLALTGELQQAQTRMQNVREQWATAFPVYAVFADHSSLDAIDQGFSRLEFSQQINDSRACVMACQELAQQFRALGEAQQLQWWNIL